MIQLGTKATDVISGYTGIVVERCEFLSGNTRYGVQGRAVDNVRPAVVYFDEEQLVAISVAELAHLKHTETI